MSLGQADQSNFALKPWAHSLTCATKWAIAALDPTGTWNTPVPSEPPLMNIGLPKDSGLLSFLLQHNQSMQAAQMSYEWGGDFLFGELSNEATLDLAHVEVCISPSKTLREACIFALPPRP